MRFAILVIALVGISAVSVQAKSVGGYTNAQAAGGTTVYTQYCAVCHGANLQGEAGTPLMGRTFLQAYGAGTGGQFDDFINPQMPLNAPGSLSQTQYLDVTAFILERNGLPPGETPLSTASLGQVSLSGMRSAAAGSASNTNEIVRVAPPTRNVYAQLPAGTNVNITDAMMLNAGSDENDWLLHGRSYDNQRYSPLKQITADNVRALTPVALVQTGMTASFETTPIVANGVMYLTTPVVDHKMKVLAVNAVTGERLWEVNYNLRGIPVLSWSPRP